MPQHHDEDAGLATDRQPERFDVAIVGAGLAGRVMALALAQEWRPAPRIVMIDPGFGRPPQDDGAGRNAVHPDASSVSRGSQNLLAAIGIWQHLSAEIQPIARIALTDSAPADRVRRVRMTYQNQVQANGDDSGWQPGAAIVANRAMLKVAADLLATTDVVQIGAGVTALHADTAGVTLQLEHASKSSSLNAALVIAADGGRSRIRQAAGLRTFTRDHGQSAMRVVIAHDRPHEATATQHFFPGGPFALLPMPGNRTCVTWSDRNDEIDRLMALSEPAFLEQLRGRVGGRLGSISLASERTRAPLITRVSHALVANRVALIGDAARSVHPIAGQGLNLAFRDVAALTECICDGAKLGLDPGHLEVLGRYQRWRRFDGVASSAVFDGLNTLFSTQNQLARAIRDVGLGLADRLPALKRALVSEASGLSGDVPRLMRGRGLR